MFLPISQLGGVQQPTGLNYNFENLRNVNVAFFFQFKIFLLEWWEKKRWLGIERDRKSGVRQDGLPGSGYIRASQRLIIIVTFTNQLYVHNV